MHEKAVKAVLQYWFKIIDRIVGGWVVFFYKCKIVAINPVWVPAILLIAYIDCSIFMNDGWETKTVAALQFTPMCVRLIQLLQFQTTALCVDWYEYIVVMFNKFSIFFTTQTVDSKKIIWTVDAYTVRSIIAN